jgi:hypothetical protein
LKNSAEVPGLVIVIVWVALVVPTVCGPNVSDVGEKLTWGPVAVGGGVTGGGGGLGVGAGVGVGGGGTGAGVVGGVQPARFVDSDVAPSLTVIWQVGEE